MNFPRCGLVPVVLLVLAFAPCAVVRGAGPAPASLEGTQPLEPGTGGVGNWDGVIQAEIDRAVASRGRFWHRDLSSPANYDRSVETNRARLARILGVRDPRLPYDAPSLDATMEGSALAGRGGGYEILRVTWPAFGDVRAEGLLLEPRGGKPVASVVAVADCAQTPEQLCGLSPGVPPGSQFARRLAESGCRVLVPALIDRAIEVRGSEGYRPYSRQPMSSREFLFRPAYELGRHPIGYEVQKILAAVDWFRRRGGPIGVMGHGEGGLLSFYAAALDPRIHAGCVSGYFDSRESPWTEPLDRSVFSLMRQFGDAEIASLVFPRALVIEACRAPEGRVPSPGGMTGVLRTPELARVTAEVARARAMVEGLVGGAAIDLVASGGGSGPFGTGSALERFLAALSPGLAVAPDAGAPVAVGAAADPVARQRRQLHEIDRHNQTLLAKSAEVRRQFMAGLDSSSVERHEATKVGYIGHLRAEVLGRLEKGPAAFNARTRLRYDEPAWTCHEVRLDAYPGAYAAGYLVVPKGLKPGERRPVVVCQHGGGGNPDQLVRDKAGAYHAFAAHLAEEGFVTFSPSVMFPPPDSLVRKCNSIGLTQYAYVAAMHQRIVDWLGSQPFVDAGRIALYGLSWGGKTAMRMPLLVDGYAMTVVSGDFNEWIWKTTTTDSDYSYVFQPEPYIFEFDLGSTYGYAEMAALIAPRPFMVERGHSDPVGSDEQVAFEFAKVQRLYDARLRLPDRCSIEWFDGGHEIHSAGTFRFLHRHLQWPGPR
ncbi:MAG: hypothetical protein DVB31_08795 [Verrucomicrobia bacterium]|nr:MAG: hypothetical protein DVB31_08795 [Verrucomicrobiota bacterium]